MAARSWLDWSVDDEAANCQYQARIHFRYDPAEPSDGITPEFRGDAQLERIEVRAVHRFTADGELDCVEPGTPAANDRVWFLLESQPRLFDEVRAACLDEGIALSD